MKRTPLRPTGSPTSGRRQPRTGRSEGRGIRRSIFKASKEQRAKVKDRPCLFCGEERDEYRTIDAAHVVPRGIGGCASEDCVVALCRVPGGGGCHRGYDDHKIDLLPYLSREEQAHAVSHLGIVAAYERLTNTRLVT